MFSIKSIPLDGNITDIDEKSGTVKGYASVFGNKDSDGDIIMPGAYTKSLKEMGPRVLHLYQHDPMRPLSSVRGGSLKLSEDARGLKFESTISPTSWGKDVIQLIKDNVISENSVGFQTMKSMDRKGYRELQELKLFEISSVSWGANDQALNTKSLYQAVITDEELTDEYLTQRKETIMKAVKNGKYSDDTAEMLDIYLMQLNHIIVNTKATTPAVQVAAKPVIDDKVIQGAKALNLLFKPEEKAIDPKLILATRLRSRFLQPH
jgi:uncharacterized protein